MKFDSIESQRSAERAKSTLGLGFLFVLLVSPIYGIDSTPTKILSVMLGASSPIYLWRFFQCQHDPVWLLNIEAISPFFVYGCTIGYFLNRKPRPSLEYAGVVAMCFIATIVLLLALLGFLPEGSPCFS